MNSARKKDIIIGMDIGGTTTHIALVTLGGNILNMSSCETNVGQGVCGVFRRISNITNNLLKETDITGKSKVLGIGVGVPGLIDPIKGIMKKAPNFPEWNNVHIKNILEKGFNIPVFVDHDVRVITLGEKCYGLAKGIDNFLCITIGTGIGLGIFCNGQLVRGAHFHAGEFGHITVLKNGPLCGCGNKGCLETLAAGPAIKAQAQKAVRQRKKTAISDIEPNIKNITAKTVFEAARRKDKTANHILDEAAEFIGIGLSILLLVLDPQLVIIGGGIAQGGKLLLNRIRGSVRRHTYTFKDKTDRIVFSKLGYRAGVLGGAALVKDRLEIQ